MIELKCVPYNVLNGYEIIMKKFTLNSNSFYVSYPLYSQLIIKFCLLGNGQYGHVTCPFKKKNV